ncbi:MAG TPA: hypothetical protein DCM86_19195 [Verrucomicrobiales bacterium]|nr:hypothetical protein [Verrucomicrobiales bacterium]
MIFPAVTDPLKATGMEIGEVELLGTMAGTSAMFPPALTISREQGAIRVSWLPGYANYRLQASTTPAGAVWEDLPGVGERSYLDPKPSGRRFFRMLHR